MNRKYYVLDTNILLSDPMSIYNFNDNVVVLTESVIEEIDSFKKGKKDININAREVSREINKLREKGLLVEGIELDNGGILKIEINHYDVHLPNSWDKSKPDNRIIQVSKYLKEQGNEVIIISKDTNMKIKADIMGIKAEDYEKEKIKDEYTGRDEIYISNKYFNLDKIEIEGLQMLTSDGLNVEICSKNTFYPNEYLLIRAIENPKQSLMGKVSKDRLYIDILKNEYSPYGITGKNIGQKFAIDALMRDDIPMVIIKGCSGTGKNFVTLACGLEQTFNNKDYRNILITREVETLGKDLGYLPGTEEEKINPFLRGFIDNLESLVDSNNKEKYKNEKELNGKVQYLFDVGTITVEAIAYMRGRSIKNRFIIIDEAQNCTISQMKGIITRIAEDTKIVILGDTEQIDNVYLDENTNGLTWVNNLMKDSPYAAQITFNDSESVRSDLVKDILNRL